MCDWVTLLNSRKLTEHRKPTIMEKNKNHLKSKKKKEMHQQPLSYVQVALQRSLESDSWELKGPPRSPNSLLIRCGNALNPKSPPCLHRKASSAEEAHPFQAAQTPFPDLIPKPQDSTAQHMLKWTKVKIAGGKIHPAKM